MMQLVKGKNCRKCGSKSVYLEHDLGHWYEHCLICGHTSLLKELKPLDNKAAVEDKEETDD